MKVAVVVVVVALLLPGSGIALAEQPAGTYTLDRGSLTAASDGEGRRYPSCGGDKLFGGLATFVVEYAGLAGQILVNGLAWRFGGFTYQRGSQKVTPPDADVVAHHPERTNRISLRFRTDGNGGAYGWLDVLGMRDGKPCVDVWPLGGTFTPPATP